MLMGVGLAVREIILHLCLVFPLTIANILALLFSLSHHLVFISHSFPLSPPLSLSLDISSSSLFVSLSLSLSVFPGLP